uniref:Zf-RVT domain-containing protein n=1 Tax=Haemonchus placei TaxID=6290 RepID=A0A0N4X2V5_HAEPC
LSDIWRIPKSDAFGQCTICFEEEPYDPVGCIHCLQFIGCRRLVMLNPITSPVNACPHTFRSHEALNSLTASRPHAPLERNTGNKFSIILNSSICPRVIGVSW